MRLTSIGIALGRLGATLALATVTSAQITTSSATPAQLVGNVLLGQGVVSSGITYTGYVDAIGSFASGTAGVPGIGFDSGVVMTTGTMLAVDPIHGAGRGPQGPAGQSASVDNGAAGDADLTTLVGRATYNASVLEFDFVAPSDTIKFDYVFASEEYPEYVGSPYNDAFAFFLTGVTVALPTRNLARLPNTTTPVQINTVNNGSTNSGPCTNCTYYVDNTGGTCTSYDGFTTVLSAQHAVVAGETYHIKLVIADVSDSALDSAVFLRMHSFTSSDVVSVNKDLRNSTGLVADGVEILVEGVYSSTISTFLGGFTGFTIVPAGLNTRFVWTGQPTAPGVVRHVGITVNSSMLKILGVFWTQSGGVIGCAPQCNSLYGTHSGGTGLLVYSNTVTACAAQTLYLGNLRIEHYLTPPDLAVMVPGGARSPVRVDVVPGLLTLPVDGSVTLPPVPMPPANGGYAMLVFDVGTTPALTDATGDFVAARVIPDADLLAASAVVGFGCGSNGPVQLSTTRPVLGSTVVLTTSNLGSFALALFSVYGFSSPNLDLTGFGMPGCTLLAATDSVTLDLLAGPVGTAYLALPSSSALVGVVLFGQSFVLDPLANALGMSASNGVMMQLGR